MDQQQFQQFLQAIQTQINADGNQQKQGEQYLNQMRDQNPDQYIQNTINIMQLGDDQFHCKQFAITQIRKLLSQFSESSYVYLWDKLTANTKQSLKTVLFQIVLQEKNSQLRKMICEAIGEIGGSLQESYETEIQVNDNKNYQHEWSELVPGIWNLFSQDNNVAIESAFIILKQIIQYSPDQFNQYKNDLYTLFKNGISNQDMAIQLAAIDCLGNYLQVVEAKTVREFDSLLPLVLESTYIMLDKDLDKGEIAVEALDQIAQAEPKFFKRQFETFFKFVQKVFEIKDLEQIIKQQCVEIVMEIISKQSRAILDKPVLIQQLCELIFYLMVETDNEVTEEWKKPAEGFDDEQEDDEEDSTKFGMNCIDRFISSLGEENTLKVLGETVEKLLMHQDWKYKYAAIMALSQVGEYIDKVEKIVPIINIIKEFFSDPVPKIRYAVVHCIGQIADDMKPDFQESFKDVILPQLINICKDPVPRVSSHGYAAITNFVESIDKDLFKPYLKDILQVSFTALQNGISIQKENAVSTIAAAAEASKNYFIEYFQEAMPILFQVYDNHTAKEYRQLRGQTIECMTLIAHGVDKQTFMPYFERTVNILISLQESNLEQVDPQKSYVLSGWQRLCLVFYDELVPYLNRIIPSLFKLVSQIYQVDTTGDDNEANTYDKGETEIAIHMLAVFINQLKSKFSPYLEPTTELLVKLLTYRQSYNIRTSAAKCLCCLLNCVDEIPQTKVKLCKYFLDEIYKAMMLEIDSEVMCSQATTMKECLDEINDPCFSQEELTAFSSKLFQLLLDSDDRRQATEKSKQDEDLDDDEQQQLAEELEQEENLHVCIAEVIGQLFRTHKDQCVDIANTIFTNILPSVLKPERSERIHLFGVSLICDMVEFLQFKLLQDKWQHLLEALMRFCVSKGLQSRQAAVYGLGIFAQVTPVEEFGKYQQQVLDSLKQALDMTNINEQKHKEKYNNKCKDNVISAFGKIIKFQNQNVDFKNLINYWIQYLPLKYDRKEGLINHYLLCELQINSPDNLLSQPANITKTISIYGQILGTKLCSKSLQEKITTCIQNLSQNDYVKQNWDSLTQGIEQKDLLKIKALFNQ